MSKSQSQTCDLYTIISFVIWRLSYSISKGEQDPPGKFWIVVNLVWHCILGEFERVVLLKILQWYPLWKPFFHLSEQLPPTCRFLWMFVPTSDYYKPISHRDSRSITLMIRYLFEYLKLMILWVYLWIKVPRDNIGKVPIMSLAIIFQLVTPSIHDWVPMIRPHFCSIQFFNTTSYCFPPWAFLFNIHYYFSENVFVVGCILNVVLLRAIFCHHVPICFITWAIGPIRMYRSIGFIYVVNI